MIDPIGLRNVVSALIHRANNFDSSSSSASNLIDPVAAGLETALLGYSTKDEWHQAEVARLRQKHLMNAIGDLQQSLVGLLPGWVSHSTGSDMPDVVGLRGDQRLIAEIKNKHNTLNSSSSKATYDEMSRFLARGDFIGSTAIVVTVIAPAAKGVYWKQFCPGRKTGRNDLLTMTGRVFYAIATDSECRTPNVNCRSTENLTKWNTWNAIDQVLEIFWQEVERQTNSKIPGWVKNLTGQAFG